MGVLQVLSAAAAVVVDAVAGCGPSTVVDVAAAGCGIAAVVVSVAGVESTDSVSVSSSMFVVDLSKKHL